MIVNSVENPLAHTMKIATALVNQTESCIVITLSLKIPAYSKILTKMMISQLLSRILSIHRLYQQ